MNHAPNRRKSSPSAEPSQVVRIGDRLRIAGKLTEQDIAQILTAQRQNNLRFGEAAVELKLLSPEDLHETLAQQFNFPQLDQSSTWSDRLVVAKDQYGRRSETIRSIRSQLSLRHFSETKKTLAITAGRSGEGASYLAANLAVSFAQLGERTLLVDADFRKPVLHEMFGLEVGPGLSEVLTNTASMSDVLIPLAPFKNLSLLCAGGPPPNPQELLGQIGFSYLVETAPSVFDVVIIDTPPLLEFADAQIVMARAGSCVLVTRRNETTLADLRQSKAMIAPTGASLIGAVLCD